MIRVAIDISNTSTNVSRDLGIRQRTNNLLTSVLQYYQSSTNHSIIMICCFQWRCLPQGVADCAKGEIYMLLISNNVEPDPLHI